MQGGGPSAPDICCCLSQTSAAAAQAEQARQRLAAADQHIGRLTADPLLTEHPDRQNILAATHTRWTHDQQTAIDQAADQWAAGNTAARQQGRRREPDPTPSYQPNRHRSGPSRGR